MNRFSKQLQTLQSHSRHRRLSLPGGTDLTSNDYLGLAHHPRLKRCALDYLQSDNPIGAAGSRLLRGHQGPHERLEHTAVSIFAAPKSLYFANGFMANYALITTLTGRQDTIIYDEYVHASMRDGIAASHAKSVRVAHNDANAFEAALKAAAHTRRTDGMIWLAVESLYSMDGDSAPLHDLYQLAVRYGAMLIVDEAHATGVLGEGGRGLAYAVAKDCAYDTIITLHTCGKALGVAGGLVCARADIIDTLINAARPFIYSTAPMPLQAALVEEALHITTGEEGEHLRAQLQTLCTQAQAALGGPGSHIVPLMIGDDAKAVKVAAALQAEGYDIRAIRPPTVPEGTARLRLSLSAVLSPQTLSDFVKAYRTCSHG